MVFSDSRFKTLSFLVAHLIRSHLAVVPKLNTHVLFLWNLASIFGILLMRRKGAGYVINDDGSDR